jgi:hypothetical protein
MEVTARERELIEAIRNFKKAKHNYSQALEWFVRELFENLLHD